MVSYAATCACVDTTPYALARDCESDDQRKYISDVDRLLAIASDENRTIVTRDRDLATRADESILPDSSDTEAQL